MKIGMLWFDNDPKAILQVKVQRASDYYAAKYGGRPNLCFVNPGTLPIGQNTIQVSGVEVRSTRSVMPNHLWIGVNDDLS